MHQHLARITLGFLLLTGLITPAFASADTVSELQAQIQSLLSSVASLTARVDQLSQSAAAGAVLGVQTSKAPDPAFVPGRILVHFKPDTSKDTGDAALASFGGSIESTIPHIDVHVVSVPVGAEQKVVEALSHNPNVEFAEVDGLVKPSAVPNDYPAAGDSWHLAIVGAQKGWDVTTGSSSVVVAVLDSGIDMTHPDLAANIVPGYNFIANTTNTDADGICPHGTGVAGMVATVGNNATGTVNVSWSNKIMPLVIAGSTSGSCLGSWSAIASAYTYAADHGVRVINISYGGTQQSSTELNAANYAWSKGAVIFASAGNSALNGNAIQYPAGDPNVVGVGGVNEFGEPDADSNYGTYVDMSAPGSYVYTTDVRSGAKYGNSYDPIGYAHLSGTSYASPMVAGLAALVLSVNPALTNQQVVDIIEKNADDFGAGGYDTHYGWGVMNMWRTLYAAASKTPPVDTMAPVVTYFNAQQNGSAVTLRANVSDDYGTARVEFYKDGTLVNTDATPNFTYESSVAGDSNGASHAYFAKAYDAAGNMAQSAASSVTLDTVAPVISSTSPQSGSTVSGTLTLSAVVTDNVLNNSGYGVNPYYVNTCWSVDVNQDPQSGCGYPAYVSPGYTAPSTQTLSWDTTSFTNGTHYVIIRAMDTAKNLTYATTTVIVQNGVAADTTAPMTSVTSPVSGATVSGTVNVTTSASDNVGVTKVELYKDGVLAGAAAAPFAFVWNTTADTNGSHTLQTKAYDAAGNVGSSAAVSVTVQNVVVNDTTAPTVSITSPANNTTIKGNGNVNIQTAASDASGIATIVIKVDGATVQTCNAVTTCSYTWAGKSITTGTHTITATATDKSSNKNVSTATVTVKK